MERQGGMGSDIKRERQRGTDMTRFEAFHVYVSVGIIEPGNGRAL